MRRVRVKDKLQVTDKDGNLLFTIDGPAKTITFAQPLTIKDAAGNIIAEPE